MVNGKLVEFLLKLTSLLKFIPFHSNDNINVLDELERIEGRINNSNGVEREIREEQRKEILGKDLFISTKKAYYGAMRKKNDQLLLGYIFCYFFGILLSLWLYSITYCLINDRIMKGICNKIDLILLCTLVVVLLIFFMVWVSFHLYRWCFWHRSFRADIQEPYFYLGHYYEEVLARCRKNSFENSFKLIRLRETQRKGWKVGFFLIGMGNVAGVLCVRPVLKPFQSKNLSQPSNIIIIWIILELVYNILVLVYYYLRFCPKMGELPKIKTVESKNKNEKKWRKDKGREEYFYELVKRIAQSRDSVLYIGSADAEDSVPSHYIKLVSTNYKYMSRKAFESEKNGLKKSSYGTIIMDFSTRPVYTPDKGDISIEVPEGIASFLKPDGELFIGTKEIRETKDHKKLINDIKSKLKSVEPFQTDFIPKSEYQVFGYRKTKAD